MIKRQDSWSLADEIEPLAIRVMPILAEPLLFDEEWEHVMRVYRSLIVSMGRRMMGMRRCMMRWKRWGSLWLGHGFENERSDVGLIAAAARQMGQAKNVQMQSYPCRSRVPIAIKVG